MAKEIIAYTLMKYYTALKREGNLAICNKIDESGGHSATWNKPVMKA